MIFFESEQKKLKNDVSINSNNLEVWNVLYLTLQDDIENIMNNKKTEAVNRLSNFNKILLNKKNIPSSAALFYRRYFLDHVCINDY